MKTLADLTAWLEAAPEGTTLSAQAVLELLREIAASESGGPIGRDLTLAEVGELYGRRPNTVREWVKSRGLRAYLDATGQYRITPAALEEWQEAQKRGGGEALEPKPGTAVNLGRWRTKRKAG